jgi:hypothetical protein
MKKMIVVMMVLAVSTMAMGQYKFEDFEGATTWTLEANNGILNPVSNLSGTGYINFRSDDNTGPGATMRDAIGVQTGDFHADGTATVGWQHETFFEVAAFSNADNSKSFGLYTWPWQGQNQVILGYNPDGSFSNYGTYTGVWPHPSTFNFSFDLDVSTMMLTADIDGNPLSVDLSGTGIDLSEYTYFGAGDTRGNVGSDTLDLSVELDNVTYTPEPATMSLLALGGLAMLRRRK